MAREVWGPPKDALGARSFMGVPDPLESRVGADEVKEEDLEGDDDEPINADLEWETTASKLREAEKSAAAADAAERKAKLAAEPYDNPLLEHVRMK